MSFHPTSDFIHLLEKHRSRRGLVLKAPGRTSSLLALQSLLHETVVDLTKVCIVVDGDEPLLKAILQLANWQDVESQHTTAESIVQIGIEPLRSWVDEAVSARFPNRRPK